jgi:serine/threonine protein kinase
VTDARIVGPFALAEVIGEGKCTGLYRAIRVDGARSPRQVAIRAALDPGDQTATDRVHREYEILRVLDDPRIPKVYGHYPELGAMAMGFVDGVTLADIIHASTRDWIALEPATALDIGIEIAHALRHAHSVRFGTGSRIVHGHLGPQRIRLQPSGEVMLVGLGAASRGRHPAYTAPEVARGARPTRASDQWSLGATLMEMLLGERLYTGRSAANEAAEEGNTHHWMDRLDRHHPAVSLALRTMLAPRPEDRFSSEPEMLKALLTASRRIGGTVHRRHMVAQTLLHADKLDAMRPARPPVTPLPLPSFLGDRDPEVLDAHTPNPDSEVWTMSNDTDTDAGTAAPPPPEPQVQFEVGLDPDPPAGKVDIPIDGQAIEPTPTPAVQPTAKRTEDTEVTAALSTPSATEPTDDLEATAPIAITDPQASSAPEPTAAYLPSEIIGMVAGAAMIGLGIWYCLKVL